MSRHRKLYAAAMVVAATALVTGVGATAHAEPTTQDFPSLSLSLPPEVKLPVGAAGRTVMGTVRLANVVAPKVIFDVSAAADVVTIAFPAGCAKAGNTVTCSLPDTTAQKEIDFPLVVKSKPGAVAGASASIPVTVRANGLGPFNEPPLKISLHDGVDLVMHEFDDAERRFTPDQRFDVKPIVVDNIGNKSAVGLRFTFGFDSGIVPTRYSDCTYTQTAATCVVPLTLPPDSTVTLPPFNVGLAKDAMGFKGIFVLAEGIAESDPAAAEVARVAKAGGTKWGASAKVGPTAAARAAREINPDDNAAEFIFEAMNTFDMEALGSTAKGKVGDVVAVSFGARNHGPGSIDISRSGGEPSYQYFFALPPGTQAVGVPAECVGVVKQGDVYVLVPGPGATFYDCKAQPDVFPVNATSTRQISLKITQVISNATGTVSFHNPFIPESDPRPNANPGNDKASVIINPTGGGLPVTGSRTGAVVALGAVLLAAGGVLYLVARRRRVVLVTPAE